MEIKKQDKKQVKTQPSTLPTTTLSEREMAFVSGGGIVISADEGVIVGN